MWWRIGIVLVLCFASIALGNPAEVNPDEAIKVLPQILTDYRKGYPTIERIANNYKLFKGLYGDLIKPTEYSGKSSRLEVNIVNGLKDEDLIYDSDHWDSGKWFIQPKPLVIPPGGIMIGLLFSPTGITGGLKFKIGKMNLFFKKVMTKKKSPKCLFVGMTNALVGEYKHFISAESCRLPAKHAYDNFKDGDIKYYSMGGYQLQALIRAPKEGAEKRFEYTIVPDATSDKDPIVPPNSK